MPYFSRSRGLSQQSLEQKPDSLDNRDPESTNVHFIGLLRPNCVTASLAGGDDLIVLEHPNLWMALYPADPYRLLRGHSHTPYLFQCDPTLALGMEGGMPFVGFSIIFIPSSSSKSTARNNSLCCSHPSGRLSLSWLHIHS